jgi:hypothetical protein
MTKRTIKEKLELVKEWIPIKGLEIGYERQVKGKPIILNNSSKLTLGTYLTYQLISTSTFSGLSAYGLIEGIKIFEEYLIK